MQHIHTGGKHAQIVKTAHVHVSVYGQGCKGGWYQDSFYYAMQHGLEGEASYGYEGSSSEGECRFREEKVVANITGLGLVWPSEDKLQEAVATQVHSVFLLPH